MPIQDRPALIVIFGITGDLARRKLLPALYHLQRDNLLSPHTRIVGVTRQKLDKDEVLKPLDTFVASHPRPSETALSQFKQSFELYNADLSELAGYKGLKKYLDNLEIRSGQEYQRLYYLSIPPSVFDEVAGLMGEAGLHKAYNGGPKPALLIEKPFGYDLESAKELIKSARANFLESQIYRIDHYLAKEMAQNILDFRMHNPLFAAVWDYHLIQKVVITAYEKIGIEGRVNFYEQTGALRDLIQSHLLQLLALTAMEVPRAQTSDTIRARRRELLASIVPIDPREVARLARRGQYEGYRDEVGSESTNTETYAEIILKIAGDRWRNVPFVLRTGKAVGHKRTDIAVHFGDNVLTLELQPEEAINLRLISKKPGHGHETSLAVMDFDYKRSYPGTSSPEAYERVLRDAINQDQTLFTSSDEVLAAWRVIQPVLDEWAKSDAGLVIYPAGELPFGE